MFFAMTILLVISMSFDNLTSKTSPVSAFLIASEISVSLDALIYLAKTETPNKRMHNIIEKIKISDFFMASPCKYNLYKYYTNNIK
jgi:hypothetical protein